MAMDLEEKGVAFVRTGLAISGWVMGRGSWSGSGKGRGEVLA